MNGRQYANPGYAHLGRHRAPEAWIPCYRQGWSITEIAEYFFSSTYMVRLYMILAGEPIRGGHSNPVLGSHGYTVAPRRSAEMREKARADRERMRRVAAGSGKVFRVSEDGSRREV